jgi:hypothetical protein
MMGGVSAAVVLWVAAKGIYSGNWMIHQPYIIEKRGRSFAD